MNIRRKFFKLKAFSILYLLTKFSFLFPKHQQISFSDFMTPKDGASENSDQNQFPYLVYMKTKNLPML